MNKIDIVSNNYVNVDVDFKKFDKAIIDVYKAGFARGVEKAKSGWIQELRQILKWFNS